jgi:hypothetical protein
MQICKALAAEEWKVIAACRTASVELRSIDCDVVEGSKPCLFTGDGTPICPSGVCVGRGGRKYKVSYNTSGF